MIKNGISIYTVVFIGDYKLLLLQLISFIKNASDSSFVDYNIVINDSNENFSFISKEINLCIYETWLSQKVKIHSVDKVLGRHPNDTTRGWKVQQAIKLSASEYCHGDIILFLDSKNHLINVFDRRILIDENNKLAANLRIKRGNQLEWLNDSFKALKIEINNLAAFKSPQTTTPFLIKKSDLDSLSREIQTDWLDFFEKSNDKATEFFMMGCFIYKKYKCFENYYFEQDKLNVTAFGKYPQEEPLISTTAQKINKKNTMFLGFHRARIENLKKNDPLSVVFINMWLRCGYFKSENEVHNFFK